MTEEEYKNKLLQVIAPLLKQKDITLTELAQKAQGATPIDLYKIVGERASNTKNARKYSGQSFSYPEPNPVDFDWRFTEETSKKIANKISSVSSSIGCFGTPSIFGQLIKKSDIKLFDINPFLQDDFPLYKDNIRLIDLDNEILDGYCFDTIIMDPPWYLDSYSNWFIQAVNNLKLGGKIFTTIIPPLVRSNAIPEWEKLISQFDGILNNENLELDVDYETPFFEHETFDSLGLGYVGNWRKTQLISYKLVSKPRLNISKKQNGNWKRFRFGNKIVSLNITSDDSKIRVKSPYLDGSYTLKSVSNRDEIRKSVNFITSRNKCLIINGTEKVEIFLQRLSLNHDFNKSIDSSYTHEEIENLKIIHSIIGL